MRVLHVLNSQGGGASIGALEFIRESRRMDSGVEHFAVYPGLSGPPDPGVASLCTACRVIPMRWWNRKTVLSPARRLAVWVREMQTTRFGRHTQTLLHDLLQTWKIDLVHSNTAAIIDGAVVARERGLPHLWHIRERIGREGFMHFPLNDSALAARIGSLSVVVVPMSRFTGEIFVRHGQAEKTRVIYDGVDSSTFDTESARQNGQALRRAWGLSDDAVLIGKVAAVTSRVKRHDIFMRAAGILTRQDPTLRFAVIGPLPKLTTWARRQGMEYYNTLRTLVTAEGLDDRFIWTGMIDDAGAVMNAVDILAHACDIEGFGRVAIEAMAAGKPVVGPSVGGLAESVGHGRTGFQVAPGDPQALALALARLVDDAGLRKQFGEAGLQRAHQDFSIETHAQRLLALYRSVLG